MEDPRSKSYAEAGVDLGAADAAVDHYKSLVKTTRIPGVLSDVGGFGGLFSLKDAGVSLQDPVLVSGTDGVGTKLKLAFELDRHDTIGIDCVAMCVNDIAVTGARPLFFLDYLATGKLDPSQAADIVGGIARACAEVGCALIGGETAEMPGFFAPKEYDVAGFCVGIVDRDKMLGAQRVNAGDALIGIASTGFHSNGYSLVRRIITNAALDLNATHGLTTTLGEALLRPTRLYVRAVEHCPHVVAAAHITGGGFHENIPRCLPPNLGATVWKDRWQVPDVVQLVLDQGRISAEEAYHVFNMGIGMVFVVPPDHVHATLTSLQDAGYEAAEMGVVSQSPGITIQ
ncbi:MAG: phosphoribosylformylglycinamidine cyclo-ligase [bacterium]